MIRGYAREVDAEALGFGVTAYVSVSIAGDQFGRVREIEARDPRLSADPRVPQRSRATTTTC